MSCSTDGKTTSKKKTSITIIGFRQQLSTQDATIQIKHQVIDGETRDSKAVLGLDLVTHSAILVQVSHLNLGERSYEYIKDFLRPEVGREDLVAREPPKAR